MILKRFAVLLAISLVALLAAVACGDGDEGAGETPEAAETPAADETPEAGETPAADETPATDGAGDEGLQELEAQAGEAAEGVTAKVTNRISTEADGETMEGEWVLVQRPPDSRFEISITEGGQESRTIIINAGGKSYLCTSVAGEESCLATEATGEETALLDPLFDIPQELEDTQDVDLVDKSERQIAGMDATCFTVSSGLADLGEGEVCFSSKGLLLYLRSEAGGTSSLIEATSASMDVTDADFEPPYEIFELPEQ